MKKKMYAGHRQPRIRRLALVALTLAGTLALSGCGASARYSASAPAVAPAGGAAYETQSTYETAQMLADTAPAEAESVTWVNAQASSQADEAMRTEDALTAEESAWEGGAQETPPADLPDGDPLSQDGDASPVPETRKLITTIHLQAETEELDALLSQIEQDITSFEGYMEHSHINIERYGSGDNTYQRRNAELTIRIPAKDLERFLTGVTEQVNLLDLNRSTEDVTLTYVDMESRKAALETEQESLLRLMEQAQNVEEIIMIEDRLTYVRYEIERLTSSLRTYDNRIDYATVHLYLSEVLNYTPVTTEKETIGERIARGFMANLRHMGNGLVDLAVGIVIHLPQLLVLAAVVSCLFFALRRLIRRLRTKKAPVTATEET